MSEDRNIAPSDEKNRIIDFTQYRYTAPDVGIYDGELRYFAVNSAWYPIVIGWIDHLAQTYAWKNADKENDHAIQQILIFEQGVDVPFLDCGDIEDCIENSPTIIEIINGGGSGYNPINAEKPIEEGNNWPIAETPVVEPENACDDDDKDRLWGAISSFVDFVDDTNKDLFQLIQVASSSANLVSILIGAIPILETLPFDELPELASWALNNLQTAYLANVTAASLYDVKCELFCIAVGSDCTFRIEDAIQYFAAESTLDLTITSTIATISPVLAAASSLAGLQWFHAISFLQLAVASLGESFVGTKGLEYYLKASQAGSLSGDTAWTVWCDECNTPETGEWTLVLDFANDYVRVGDEYVVRNAFNLLKDSSQVGEPTFRQAFQKGIIFKRNENSDSIVKTIDFQDPVELSHYRMNWRRSDGAGTMTGRVQTSLYAPSAASTTSSTFDWTSQTPITDVSGSYNDVSSIILSLSLLLSSQRGETELRYIELWGQGTLPKFE